MKISAQKEKIVYRLTLAAVISFVSFVAVYTTKMPFLTDSFLIADDLIYIPRWQMEGFFIPDQGIIVFVKFLNMIFLLFQEPGLFRVVLIVAFTLAIGIFASALLHEFSALNVVLFSLLIALIQMGVNQAMFIVGSYPMLGVALVLTAFSFVYHSSKYASKPLLLMIPGYIFVTMAQLVHPVFIFAPAAFIVLTPIFNKKYAIINLVCVATSYILRVVLMSTYVYHYGQLKGWVQYDLGAIISRIKQSLTYFWSTVNVEVQILFALILCTGIIFLLISLKKNELDRINNKKVILAFFFLALGVLTYGPTVVIKHLSTRYFYAPQLFLLISLLIFTTSTVRKKNGRLLVNTLLGLLLISFYINAQELHKNSFTGLQQTQHDIKGYLNKHYLPSTSPNDQVIVFLNPMLTYFTGGYNHWSTWFLRYQTGNKNLIGLVGAKAQCNADPFIENYTDHSKEYWGIKLLNNKEVSYRIPMKGLEADRNTFVFEQTDQGFSPIQSIIVPTNSGEYQIAELGKPFRKVHLGDPALLEALTTGFFWPVGKTNFYSSKTVNIPGGIRHNGKYMELRGNQFFSEEFKFANSPSALVFETMLRSNENEFSRSEKTSESYPPMPLRAHPLAIYQTSIDNYTFQIKHKNGDKYIDYKFNPALWQKFVFSFDLDNNILYIFINDSISEVIKDIRINVPIPNSITLGKGYHQRFWRGDVAFFNVYEPAGSLKNYYVKIVPDR